MAEVAKLFQHRLRRLRQAAGLSQEELAERAGLTAAAIGALERGERRYPYPHTLHALAGALDLSPEERTAFFRSVPPRPAAGNLGKESGPDGRRLQARPATPLTPLVGRVGDLAMVEHLLESRGARIVTLTGPGGVGKTRLAMELAARLGGRFESGVAWVDLCSVREPDLVLPTVVRCFGLTEEPGQSSEEVAESYLVDKSVLLVLDNFEQVMRAASAVTALVERCPRVSALITSRQALRTRGEHEVLLAPLGLAETGGGRGVEEASRSDAVRLFLQRVQGVAPRFVLNEMNAPIIAAICARLDGIPLALELAAVQLRYLSPTQLLDRLESRRGLPEGGLRDLPARQQSLRATIAWSYDLLTPREQRLFRRLAVFADGFTVEAVHAICGEGAPGEEALTTLAALIDKSVVRAVSDRTGEVRFTMLETIAEFARERLAESAETGLFEARHAAYYCDLAEAAEPFLGGPDREPWIRQFEVEHANLHAALAFATSRGNPCIGMRLVAALAWYWLLRGDIREGTRWAELVVSKSDDHCGAGERAGALYTAAGMAWKREDYAMARRYVDESVQLRRALGDRRHLAFSLAISAHVAFSEGDAGRARQLHEESLLLFEQVEDAWGTAYALANLGDVLFHQGDVEGARQGYLEALAHFTSVDDPWGRAIVLHMLGNVARADGDRVVAGECFAEAAALFRQIGNMPEVARSRIGQAAAGLDQGDVEGACRLLSESINIWRDFGNRSGVAMCLEGFGGVEVGRGHDDRAVQLFAAAEAHSQGRPTLYVIESDLFLPYLAGARERLGPAFGKSWEAGARMSVEQALGLVRADSAGDW